MMWKIEEHCCNTILVTCVCFNQGKVHSRDALLSSIFQLKTPSWVTPYKCTSYLQWRRVQYENVPIVPQLPCSSSSLIKHVAPAIVWALNLNLSHGDELWLDCGGAGAESWGVIGQSEGFHVPVIIYWCFKWRFAKISKWQRWPLLGPSPIWKRLY